MCIRDSRQRLGELVHKNRVHMGNQTVLLKTPRWAYFHVIWEIEDPARPNRRSTNCPRYICMTLSIWNWTSYVPIESRDFLAALFKVFWHDDLVDTGMSSMVMIWNVEQQPVYGHVIIGNMLPHAVHKLDYRWVNANNTLSIDRYKFKLWKCSI